MQHSKSYTSPHKNKNKMTIQKSLCSFSSRPIKKELVGFIYYRKKKGHPNSPHENLNLSGLGLHQHPEKSLHSGKEFV